jgi:hypothetical protein
MLKDEIEEKNQLEKIGKKTLINRGNLLNL